MKKLNKFIIERFPTLWNVRFVYVVPALLLAHLMFFLMGRASVDLEGLKEYYRIDEAYFESGAILFGILISVLVFVMWLLFYLRNNPLKKFYPHSSWKLLLEYGMVLLICLLNVSFAISYSVGQHSKAGSLFSKEDLTELKTALRDVAPYTVPYKGQFDEDQYCYEMFGYNSMKEPALSAEEYTGPDSLETAGIYNLKDSLCCGDVRYSYYYFCSFPYTENNVELRECITRHQSMLLRKDRESITRIVNRYAALQEKYNVNPKMDAQKVLARVFAQPGFEFDDEKIEFEASGYDPMERLVSNQEKFQDSGNDFRVLWLVHLYIAILFSVFIFSFRLTDIRSWLISVVGLGILGILITVFNIVAGIRDEGFAGMYLLVMLGIAVTAFVGSFVKMNKMLYGAFLNAALWNSVWILLLLVLVSNERYMDSDKGTYIGFASLGLGLLQIIVYILRARAFRAKPEE
ncbi:MAG: hypothetical protein IBJ09_14330 [Bacteroidia bacterium]|nr:hypothetical protein [Bacteroidia bacterium]